MPKLIQPPKNWLILQVGILGGGCILILWSIHSNNEKLIKKKDDTNQWE